MTGWRWFGGLVMLSLIPLLGRKEAAFAQDDKEVTLEIKSFGSDAKPFYQELTTVTDQTMKVMGQEVIQKQTQTFIIKWTPEKDATNWTVVEEIVGVKMNIDIGGNKIAYDSSDKAAGNNPMSDFFNALKSLKLTLVIDPKTLTIKEIKGREEFVNKLGAANPQMQPLLKNILSEDAIKNMAEPTWGAVPRKAVKKGDTWSAKSTLKLGAIGNYDTNFDYTYDGVSKDEKSKGLDKISVKAKLKYGSPTDKNGLPFTIKENSTLESTKGEGTVYFDRAKGRIDNSKMEMTLKGTLVIEVGGMQTDVALEQTQTSTMKTSDTDPTAAAEKTK